MQWIQQLFKTQKPIVAMCHFRALPGDPYYDADGGMEKVVDMARTEFLALQEGGVDAGVDVEPAVRHHHQRVQVGVDHHIGMETG